MRFREFRWWLCTLLEIHTPGPVRIGESVGTSKFTGKFLFRVPFRECVYCGDICRIGR